MMPPNCHRDIAGPFGPFQSETPPQYIRRTISLLGLSSPFRFLPLLRTVLPLPFLLSAWLHAGGGPGRARLSISSFPNALAPPSPSLPSDASGGSRWEGCGESDHAPPPRAWQIQNPTARRAATTSPGCPTPLRRVTQVELMATAAFRQ